MVKKSKHEIPEELVEILCCPTDKGELEYDKEKNVLICKDCKNVYRVEKGIPILLP